MTRESNSRGCSVLFFKHIPNCTADALSLQITLINSRSCSSSEGLLWHLRSEEEDVRSECSKQYVTKERKGTVRMSTQWLKAYIRGCFSKETPHRTQRWVAKTCHPSNRSTNTQRNWQTANKALWTHVILEDKNTETNCEILTLFGQSVLRWTKRLWLERFLELLSTLLVLASANEEQVLPWRSTNTTLIRSNYWVAHLLGLQHATLSNQNGAHHNSARQHACREARAKWMKVGTFILGVLFWGSSFRTKQVNQRSVVHGTCVWKWC